MFKDITYEKNSFVTLENANFRSSLISNVKYDVSLKLARGDHFYGSVNISFDLIEKPQKTLSLDFRGLKICNFSINGKNIENGNIFTDHKIELSHL